jgi:hypothetical protein
MRVRIPENHGGAEVLALADGRNLAVAAHVMKDGNLRAFPLPECLRSSPAGILDRSAEAHVFNDRRDVDRAVTF